MPERNLGKPSITTLEDVKRYIPRGNGTERGFAQHLLQMVPDVVITYEAVLFEGVGTDGIQRCTIPDFQLDFPTGRRVYVEITRRDLSAEVTVDGSAKTIDPKERQKEAMQAAAPDTRYVVLYGETLRRIELKHGVAIIPLERRHKRKKKK